MYNRKGAQSAHPGKMVLFRVSKPMDFKSVVFCNSAVLCLAIKPNSMKLYITIKNYEKSK